MKDQLVFNFKSNISGIDMPEELNNPFGAHIPEIARIAAKEFQEFIAIEAPNWPYDFKTNKGKMFGVLVVQNKENEYCYLATVSGKLSVEAQCDKFVPSVFDDSVGDFFIHKGMTALTAIGYEIKNSTNPDEIIALIEKRRLKSIALQQRLFENYCFTDLSGNDKYLLDIFKDSSNGTPPSAAGECAAPKLLQYSHEHGLKPIAIVEFWWGSSNKKRVHKVFYPACKDKCKPILEFMLEDSKLFDIAQN